MFEGELLLEVDADDKRKRLILGPQKSFHVTPGTIHPFIVEQTVVIMEVSTPELDDVVRLEDRYGRKGTTEV